MTFAPSFRSAFFILRRSRGFKVLAIVSMVTPAIAILLQQLLAMRLRAQEMLQGNGSEESVVANAFVTASEGAGYGLLFLGLCSVTWTAATTARQFESTHLRFIWTRGISRTDWFISHTVVLTMAVLFCELLLLASATLISSCFHDFGPITQDGIELWSTGEISEEIVRALWCVTVPLLASVALGVASGVAVRSVGFAATFHLILTLALDLFQDIFAGWGRYTHLAYLPSFRDHSYWVELKKFLQGFSDAGFAPELLTLNAWVPSVQAILFLILGWWITLRRRA